MKTKIDWTDKEAVRMYIAGYMRQQRLMKKHLPNSGATELARQVMVNEIDRHSKVRIDYVSRRYGRES